MVEQLHEAGDKEWHRGEGQLLGNNVAFNVRVRGKVGQVFWLQLHRYLSKLGKMRLLAALEGDW